ncbi:ABC transporter permease [Methanoregula sp.]|uniref:ABC transporter permease n=1 Tax=Methanoregula sp. TaxID=2052170 RepID=UPI0023746BE5|nr:ABC transporter permease [Methanoregula sp.]MDD1687201.1 ABC transporter permease [Methanoregula sp.]
MPHPLDPKGTPCPSPSSQDPRVPTLVIRPPRKWVPVDLRELWAYRELITSFTLRDVKLRYKQTGLGIAWAVLQPLLTMLIFTVIFGGLAKIPSDGVPYPLFVLAALLPWMLFAEGLTRSTTSMISNANIMTKVYFPRLIMPLSSIISPLIDFAVSFLILMAMMVYYGFMPTINIVFLPVFLLLALATSLGVGLWLSALNVKYRDFQYTVPFLIQIWMFASPVVYSSSLVPESLRMVFGLNPMTGVIEGFRWALLGSGTPSAMVLVSVGMVIVLLVTGMFYFRRMEQYYADIV